MAALGLATEELVEVDLVVREGPPKLSIDAHELTVDKQCASLGSVNHDLVTAIYNACRGRLHCCYIF